MCGKPIFYIKILNRTNLFYISFTNLPTFYINNFTILLQISKNILNKNNWNIWKDSQSIFEPSEIPMALSNYQK